MDDRYHPNRDGALQGGQGSQPRADRRGRRGAHPRVGDRAAGRGGDHARRRAHPRRLLQALRLARRADRRGRRARADRQRAAGWSRSRPAPRTRWPHSPTPTCPPRTATTRRAGAAWRPWARTCRASAGRRRRPTARRSSATSPTCEPLLGGDDDARRRATVTLSAMVGAVMIARALGPTPGSDEILRDVREAVRERRLL